VPYTKPQFGNIQLLHNPPPSADQISAMLAAASPRDAALVALMVVGALRVGEATLLAWEDVKECSITIPGGVTKAMVSSGAAFAYRKYLAACDGPAYLGAEAAAQRQRVGVWAVPGGIQRPWDWRKGARPPTASTATPFPPAAGSAPPAAAPAGGYSGRKLTCRQINSYARAQELLRQGHTYLDKNGDGVACESLR